MGQTPGLRTIGKQIRGRPRSPSMHPQGTRRPLDTAAILGATSRSPGKRYQGLDQTPGLRTIGKQIRGRPRSPSRHPQGTRRPLDTAAILGATSRSPGKRYQGLDQTPGLPIVRKPGVWSNPWYRFPGDLDVAPRMAAVSNGLRTVGLPIVRKPGVKVTPLLEVILRPQVILRRLSLRPWL